MRIILDATGVEGRYGGISRYASRLTQELAEIAAPKDEFLILVQEGLEADHPLLDRADEPGWRLRRLSTPALGPKRQIALGRFLGRLKNEGGWDLLHTLRTEAPLYQPFPTLVTIHDLKYLQDASFLLGLSRLKSAYLRWSIGLGLRQAAGVFAVSEHTKSDVADFFSIDEDLVHVTHLASDMDETLSQLPVAEDEAALERLGVEGDFVLWIGSFLPHKNVENMLRGFAGYREEAGDEALSFVAVGQPDHRYERVLQLADDLGVADSLVTVHDVPDEALASLYRQASALFFVSRYEGFGIPLLEATHAGTPVITSSTTATAEVAGEAGLCVDPEDPDAIADALERVRTSAKLRRRLVEAGERRADEFDWSQTARATYEVYEAVADRAS